jgi:hypothetical protein
MNNDQGVWNVDFRRLFALVVVSEPRKLVPGAIGMLVPGS